MRDVIAQADAVIHAIALPPRIALHQRCAGEERARIALRVTQATVERQAADHFPTGVDVRDPGSRREIAEGEPQSRPDGQTRATGPQRIPVGGIESGRAGEIALPAIAPVYQPALSGVVSPAR